jgi:hypothetical protein
VVVIKVFLNVIGWIGFAIIGISLPLLYTCAGPNVGMIGMCLGVFSWIADLGVVLLLIGLPFQMALLVDSSPGYGCGLYFSFNTRIIC